MHGLEVRGAERMLFVSGTMGLRPDFTAPATLEEQLECVWNNLRAVLASAGMTVDNIVRLTSYLRDASYAEANAQARIAALGKRRIPTTAIVVQTLQSEADRARNHRRRLKGIRPALTGVRASCSARLHR